MGQYCNLPRETCRRHYLLELLGSPIKDTENIDPVKCCDNCSRVIPYHQLAHILSKVKVTRKKKRCKIRVIADSLSEALEERLKEERHRILQTSIGYQFLGEEIVCPLKSIQDLCKHATWIQSIDDVLSIGGVRQEFAENFYNILLDVTVDAPPPSKRSHLRKK